MSLDLPSMILMIIAIIVLISGFVYLCWYVNNADIKRKEKYYKEQEYRKIAELQRRTKQNPIYVSELQDRNWQEVARIKKVISEQKNIPAPEPTPESPKPKDILDDVDVEYYIRSIALEMATDGLPYIPDSFSHSNYLYPEDDKYTYTSIDLNDRDPLFDEAARLIVIHQQGSTGLIQRKFSIGYNRAGRLMDQLEAVGIVGPTQGSKARDVLIADEFSLEQKLNSLI